jgi:hypothetical protein
MLRSKQFKFLIGPEEESITVHAGVIAALSPPLERHVNWPMKEAQEGVARFPKLEVCDFDRICEFAYRGDYTNPEATIYDEADVDIKTDFYILSDCLTDRYPDLERGSHKSKSLDQAYYNTFNGRKLGREGKDLTSDERNCWRDNVAPVLLGHAHLYVFAQQYMIKELADLALNKLFDYLAQLKVYSLTRKPVVEILEYAYNTDNIMDRGDCRCVDRLRKMVLDFIDKNEKAFHNFSDWKEVLRMEGEYAVDVVNLLRLKVESAQRVVVKTSQLWMKIANVK